MILEAGPVRYEVVNWWQREKLVSRKSVRKVTNVVAPCESYRKHGTAFKCCSLVTFRGIKPLQPVLTAQCWPCRRGV